ncbi:MAG: DsbA family protein [Chloroflexota bacterium]|nr:DsbA family protein [Chloroflexota bacterium]
MSEVARVALYADLACPYAYIAAYRLRKLRDEYRGRVSIEHKSLALEYVNRQPTPKRVLDSECPLLMLEEPELAWEPWHAPLSEWPVTLWPAFEAVKCAERQDMTLADDLDWAIRTALFAESRCVSMRHVLLELAERVGLAMDRFTQDFDSGQAKALVIAEAREGWERLKVPGSPTLVLPSGRQIGDAADLGLPEVLVDEQGYGRVTGLRPAPCHGEDCLALYRGILDAAVGGA